MLITLKAKRFILRPLRKSDASSLVKNINDQEIAHNTFHIPYPYTLRDAHKWISESQNIAREKRPRAFRFALDVKGEVAGDISLRTCLKSLFWCRIRT